MKCMPTTFYGNDVGTAAGPQLFHIASNPGETRNLGSVEPRRVKAMAAKLEPLRAAGRSRSRPASVIHSDDKEDDFLNLLARLATRS